MAKLIGLALDIVRASRAAVPLVSVSTPDAEASTRAIVRALGEDRPIAQWDLSRGASACTEAGKVTAAMIDPQPGATAGDPWGMARAALALPPDHVLIVHGAGEWIGDPQASPVRQAILNLRSPFKSSRRMLILLGFNMTLPPNLAGDFAMFEETLPTFDELKSIVVEQDGAACASAEESGIKRPAAAPATVDTLAGVVLGLSSFGAEQALAMSVTSKGFDLPNLWRSKDAMVNAVPGLRVERCSQTFQDVRGLAEIARFSERIFTGPNPPRVVVRVEEIEKTMSGAQGDTSGVSQDALQQLLTCMEDYEWSGLIAYGPPGTGKSYYSKVLAATYGAYSLSLDMGALKGSLVGESEKKVRAAMQVVRAIGGDRVFFVASCNKLDTLKSELRRRFTGGVWFFDMPNEVERKALWGLYMAKYGLTGDLPRDAHFSSANIRDCCRGAYNSGCSVVEYAQWVPAAGIAGREAIQDARSIAEGKYHSASRAGLYTQATDAPAAGGRKVSVWG